jgi:DNA polymerase-1
VYSRSGGDDPTTGSARDRSSAERTQNPQNSSATQPTTAGADVVLVTDDAGLRAELPRLLAEPALGLDIETAVAAMPVSGVDHAKTSLDPRLGRLSLVQLAGPERVVMVDAFACDPGLLAPVLDRCPRLIGHNLRFDLAFLAEAGLPVPDGERLFDTMLAARVVEAGDVEFRQVGRFTLAAVAERYAQVRLDKSAQRSDWSRRPLTDEQLRYAAEDARVLVPLAEALDRELALGRLEQTAALEMQALPAVLWLERTGAPFDRPAWQALAHDADAERAALELALTAEAQTGDLFGASTVKWSSPGQVADVLRRRGHEIEQTDEATLLRLVGTEPLAELLLRYREASKRATSYGTEYLKAVHPATGRIHADYWQLGSEAGRMSCRGPNLQQVPRSPTYRACFRPADGRVLVKADYSQIELRIAAEISGDERLIEAYQRGEDVHTLTAATVLGVEGEAVTKADRQAAKCVNFGLLYGMGATTLCQHARSNYGVELTEQDAGRFRSQFFRLYRGLRRWHESRRRGTVQTRTVLGRRRLNVTAFTQKCNTPVQGTGADGLRAALALLWETRDRVPTASPVLCVHDEIVVECDAADAEAARDWLVDCMTRGMQRFLVRVTVVVEATIARDWSGTPLSMGEADAA